MWLSVNWWMCQTEEEYTDPQRGSHRLNVLPVERRVLVAQLRWLSPLLCFQVLDWSCSSCAIRVFEAVFHLNTSKTPFDIFGVIMLLISHCWKCKINKYCLICLFNNINTTHPPGDVTSSWLWSLLQVHSAWSCWNKSLWNGCFSDGGFEDNV